MHTGSPRIVGNRWLRLALLIELGGTDASTDQDVFDVEGLASLDGNLEVLLVEGFDPEAGGSFDILDFSSRVRAFSESHEESARRWHPPNRSTPFGFVDLLCQENAFT